jgi:hypothetical protein
MVRFRSASKRKPRPFSKRSALQKKTVLTLKWAKKQKGICKTTATARRGGMQHRKWMAVAMIQLRRLILAKAWVMLPRIQAE